MFFASCLVFLIQMRRINVLWIPSLALLYLFFGAVNSMAQDIRVESAYYGAGGGGAYVTGRVQRFADYGEPFRVSNDTLRIDPSPNRGKTLRVVYSVNGRRFFETVSEGEVFYFRNGGYGIVRDRVRYRMPFKVANETFGVDPYPGKGKNLKIYYIRGGQQRENEYREGDTVRIW